MGAELERMRRLVAGWDGLDITDNPDGFADIPWMAEDIVFEMGSLGLPDEGDWVGREAVRRGWTRWLEQWDDYRITGNNLEQHDSHVVVDVEAVTVGHGSRVPVNVSNTQVWTFRDLELVRVRVFDERKQALEAISRSAPTGAPADRTPPAR